MVWLPSLRFVIDEVSGILSLSPSLFFQIVNINCSCLWNSVHIASRGSCVKCIEVMMLRSSMTLTYMYLSKYMYINMNIYIYSSSSSSSSHREGASGSSSSRSLVARPGPSLRPRLHFLSQASNRHPLACVGGDRSDVLTSDQGLAT